MIAAVKAISQVIGLIDFWSKYFGKKEDQNTGRKLQSADNAAATIAAAKETRADENDVHRLSDADLDRELRGQAPAGPV